MRIGLFRKHARCHGSATLDSASVNNGRAGMPDEDGAM